MIFSLIACCSVNQAIGQVLNYQTVITIDQNGKKITEKRILIQINSKAENKLSHIEIHHDPKQNFKFKFARIIDVSANVVKKIKKKDLATRNDLSYGAFYQDDLITEFDLYWNDYPYQVEYAYSIEEEEYFSLANWTPILFINVPTVKSRLEIHTPLDYKVRFDQSEYFEFFETIVDNEKIYSWEMTNARSANNEIHSLNIMESIPMVRAMPLNFRYGVDGNSDSWSSFGRWLNDLNEGMDLLPVSEKKFVENLVGNISDETAIVKKIYNYLQDQTRYLNVAIDVGGLKTYPASYVCENKYGDCKALTNYMRSMLNSVGIKSYYTVVNAGKNQSRINTAFPSQQFNHVILMIPLTNDTIWLENTSNVLPFDYLGTFTQNRYALVVDEVNSQLIKTPKLSTSDVLVKRDFICNNGNGNTVDWNSKILLDLRGDKFESFISCMKNENEATQIEMVLENVNLKGFDIENWNTDFHRDSCNIKIEAEGKFNSPIRKIGKLEVIKPLKILLPSFEKPSERKLDLRINYPIHQLDKSIYQFEQLLKDKIQLPEAVEIKNSYGRYSTTYEVENNKLIAMEQFVLFANEISINEYPKFHEFIQSIINHKKSSAIIIQ